MIKNSSPKLVTNSPFLIGVSMNQLSHRKLSLSSQRENTERITNKKMNMLGLSQERPRKAKKTRSPSTRSLKRRKKTKTKMSRTIMRKKRRLIK